jgi:hypothetical protein
LSEFFRCNQRQVGPKDPEVEPIQDLGPLAQEIADLQSEARNRNQP